MTEIRTSSNKVKMGHNRETKEASSKGGSLYQKDFQSLSRSPPCPNAKLHRLASFAEPFNWDIGDDGDWVQCNHCIWDEVPNSEIYAKGTVTYNEVVDQWNHCAHPKITEQPFVMCPKCHIMYRKKGVTEKTFGSYPSYLKCAREHAELLFPERKG